MSMSYHAAPAHIPAPEPAPSSAASARTSLLGSSSLCASASLVSGEVSRCCSQASMADRSYVLPGQGAGEVGARAGG